VILGLIVIAVPFATAALGNILGMSLRHGNGSWTYGVGGFRDIILVLLTGLIQGMAFGMLLLISAAAVILYYVLPNVWSAVFNSVPALKGIAPWVDLNAAQSALYVHHMTGKAWAQLLVAVVIWVAAPMALGVVRVLRSEVKSA
jgi:ABC-2 type transport system permease protein